MALAGEARIQDMTLVAVLTDADAHSVAGRHDVEAVSALHGCER